MGAGFLVLVLLWVALTRSREPVTIMIGGIVAAGVILVQWRLFPHLNPFPFRVLLKPHRLFKFLVVFFARFVASTVHTSRLILLGGEEGQIVALPISIRDPIGRFILLNSITFTPSTISLLLEGDLLYIHWLRKAGSKGDWEGIKASLEGSLRPLFDRKKDGIS